MKTVPALAVLLLAGIAGASEGKWTPQQLLQIDASKLRAAGLRVPPRALWNPKEGTGLLAAAVNVGGCSGAFISADGLLLTNHHCLFRSIQENSTPERDLISTGFLARRREDELPGKGDRVHVPRRFEDVTRDVLAAVPPGAGDLARFRAIEARQKALVADCERRPATRCQVEVFDGGVSFVLVESLEIADVRLVYVPPRAVGEYGGEVDNWSWPRHTGDFAIARAWVAPDGNARPFDAGNVPYRPRFFLPLSQQGVSPGDFVAVLGYPAITYRALLAEEMAERQELWFPRVREVSGEWIRILDEVTDESGRIAVAATRKTLENRHKNAEGQLAGFARAQILPRQRRADEEVAAWARRRPKHREALAARAELVTLLEESRRVWERDFLLQLLLPEGPGLGPKGLWLAIALAWLSEERERPDEQRQSWAMERERPRLRERLERAQKGFHAPADERLMGSLVRRALALPPGQRLEAIDGLFGTAADTAAIDAKVHALYAGSRVMDAAERAEMFDEPAAVLRARRDPLLALGFALAAQLRVATEEWDRRKGASYRLRPPWRRAVLAHAGRPVAPDGNRTLRISLAKVVGYSPRDGVWYQPQTTLSGMLAKDQGKPPFELPERIRAVAEAGRLGRWRDSKLGDVPVDFLSDADTTGGNSGSPVIDGHGRLVGINFDRVWENVANDFGYNPAVARNVSVDVRYLLWHLDQVEEASELLAELGIRR